MNLWIKRAIGAAALGGGLLAATAGAAGAQEVSADASARLGRPTSADVRVCADGQLLSRLVGSCSQAGSGTTANVRADRAGVRVRARVPRLASADVSLGTRRSRPWTTVSADASATPRSRAATAGADASADTSPRADADAAAQARWLVDLDATASLAGVGLLGSSPFTLVGDPAGDPLLAIGDLTLADVAGQAPAGIGVLDTGPIASGNQATVDVGDVSPSLPVTVCGNGVGLLGDASAACAADTSTGGTTAPPPGTTDPGGSTDTDGIQGTPGSTGTSGIPGTTGLTPGTDGGAGDPITTFSARRPSVADSSLPFTGAAGDLLALVAAGLLAAGVLIVRAARPAAAATEGGEDR